MFEPCGAVPPPSIYGRGVYVAPCTLAPGHSGTHLPGNMDELNALPRGRNRRNPNPPMYPGTQSSVPRGPAIDVEPPTPRPRLIGFDYAATEVRVEEARAAAEAFQAAYPELMKIIRGRTVTPDDAQPAPNVGTDLTMYPRKDA